MAYSRWSSSFWYTYWDTGSSEDTKEGQIFTVYGVTSFTYREIKNDLEKCARQCRISGRGPATDEDIEELKKYMTYFLEDMDTFFAKRKDS